MVAVQHRRAVEQHRVVEQGALALLDRLEPAGDVGHLLHEEPIHLEPVGRVAVREQMVDHVVHPQVREPQRAVVVVQLEGGDPRGVGLEPEHQDVAHELHVLGDVLRDAVGRAGHVGLRQRRPPPLQLPLLAGIVDALLHVADRIEVLVELAAVVEADLPAQTLRIGQDGIEHTAVALLVGILEQPVEGQRRIDLQRRGGRRRRPRDVRAVEHRVVLVDRRVGLLAAQHQARHLGRPALGLGHELIEAGARADLAARGQRCPGKQVARLRTVDVPLQRLGIVEPADEHRLLAEVVQRGQHLTELHLCPLAARPPFLGVEPVAGEQHRHAHGRLAGRTPAGRRRVAPDREGLHPREGHGDADASKECAPIQGMLGHGSRGWRVEVILPTGGPFRGSAQIGDW